MEGLCEGKNEREGRSTYTGKCQLMSETRQQAGIGDREKNSIVNTRKSKGRQTDETHKKRETECKTIAINSRSKEGISRVN